MAAAWAAGRGGGPWWRNDDPRSQPRISTGSSTSSTAPPCSNACTTTPRHGIVPASGGCSTTRPPACCCCCSSSTPWSKAGEAFSRPANSTRSTACSVCHRDWRGSLSEASRVFDPELRHALRGDLATQAFPLVHGKEAAALRGLTAVDGSLLPALPPMAWALGLDPHHHVAQMHLHFDVRKGVSVQATVTTGNGSAIQQVHATLQPQRLYVSDRGYAEYPLVQDIIDAQRDGIGRIRVNAVGTVEEARAAGVRRDRVAWLGGPQRGQVFQQAVRVLEVDTGKTDTPGRPEMLLRATSRLDRAAALVALGYRFRGSVERFCRWLKGPLGCRHLLANSQDGITI